MKIIKTIILDDELKATENLAFLIQSYCKKLEIVAIYTNPLEALEGIKKLAPDLLFLDVEMPHLDGFQLLDILQKEHHFKVIFTTAYKDYALNAIKKSASDFLLKPIDIQELIMATDKIATKMNNQKKVDADKPQLMKIASINGFDFLNINDIDYLKSTNNTIEIFYILNGQHKKVMATKSIKHFEEALNGYSFFRIHDSYIVNLNKIKQYIKGEGGTVVMQDDTEIDVSRRRKQDFLSLFLN